MEILISIMGKIAEYTVAPIKKQVGYLIFYKDNFEELHIQVQELEGVRDQIKHCIEAERRNGREIEGAMLNWLGKVDEIIELVKQLVKDPHHRSVGCSNWSFLDLWSQHQLSKNAKKMAKKIIKVRQGKEKFNQVGYMPPLDKIGSTSATKGSEKLESRKLMKEDIMLALRDPKISKIGVYGLSGVGKTTLVKEVEKQVKDDKLFDAVVIANVSKTPDLERIQCEIADHLGLHFEEMTIIGRARRLCERIKKEKSILIILDDIWKRLDLKKLEIPSEDDHKRCKLLLTSRNQDILRIMGSEKDFRLDVLNEEETWSLFEDMAVDVVKDASLQSIATQVAKKCAGLPILIVTVARALRNKDINHWKDALNQLPRVDNKGINEIVYSALEFSYNNLDSDEVKAIFLLCGVLYSNIPFEYLLKCVIGLGIFKHINTLKDARFRLHKLIDSLKASCLLLESNTHTKVEMHYTISEVALSIATRDQHVIKIGSDVKLNEWPTEDLLQRCPHMIILEECHIHKLPERLECPNVEFFYLYNSNSSLGIPNSFFEAMRNLTVLDLTCMHLPSLPKSFCSLIDLQTLCLDQCALGDMTNIGALKNLQILSLYESSMIRLPSELAQLTLLRMLDLTHSRIEIIPSNIISKLTKLEELYMGNTSIKWELENSIEENRNANLAELKHLTNLTALEFQIQEAWILPRDLMFERLERYKIVIGEVWEWSDNYGASKMLKLKLGTNIHLEHGIKELVKEVEDLYLDKINGISNVLYHLNGEGFPMLKHLYIQNNVEIQHIINSMERNQTHVLFPNLETLILQNLNNLEKICHGPLTVNSFGKLRVIKVKSCNRLEYLFSILIVEAFSQLLEIEVSKCSSIKKIVLVESANSGRTIDDKIEFYSLRSLTLRHLPIIDDFCSNELMSSLTTKQNSLRTNVPTSFFNAKVKFSNLETLKLSSINLEKVWDDDHLSAACSIHNLAKLIVEDCRGLKYLFSSSMIESLLNLKQLEISKCDMMEEIIATKGRNVTALEEVRLSKLETIAINNMKSLKKVWHFQFDGLKTLEVNDCGKLQNIFPSYLQRTFGSLETLKVSDCSSMEEIFELTANEIQSEEDTTTELKKLHLLRLPKLKRIWSNDPQGILRFNNLQDMHVEYCENIEYVFPFSIAMDLLQLEKLHMNSCGMKEIVAEKEGPIGEKAIFHFHRLHSLTISNMHKLNGFYAGNHILACPWLRVLRGFKCAKLELFERQCRSSQRKNSDSKTHVSRQQPLFIVEEVIPSLEELNLSYKDTIMILQDQQWRDHFRKLKILRLYDLEDKQAATLLDSILQKAPNLETLVVQDSSLKEIFQDERLECKEGKNEISTQLKMLTLSNLQLQHICREGCQIDSILEVLGVLYVTECASLKNLVPSSVSFSHLTYLEIRYCNGLINLISSSTARSLVKLQSMTLKECNSLEEIVTQEVIEAKDEIVFSSLKILELECLPRLNSFSFSKCFFKFPMLKKVVVRQCPMMKIFSASETRTPMLRKVLKEENDEEWCWEGDLNGTIRKMFLDKVAFRNSKHLDLSMYPELKGLWYNQVENKIFCNLKSLVVQKCDFLSNVLISSNFLRTLCNLEELVVGDCDSLEVVLEFNSKHEGGMLEKEALHLRKISLSNLPSLKHIWTQDYQAIVSFGDLGDVHEMSKAPGFGGKREEDEPENQRQRPLFSVAKVLLPNLETIIINDMQNLKTIWHPILTPTSMGSFKTLDVNNCEKLENLFPSYMHGAFASLETLTVSDCNSVQVIFQLGVNDMRSAEDTTQLKNITLLRLPQLKQIWSRDPQTILRFHNLQVVRVEDCEDLEYLFPFSIAMDLLQLEEITIKHAVKMKEIVSKNEEPADSPVKFEFNHITSLVLWYLYELKGFFAGNHSLSCPSLRQLDVRHCAKWKLFKTQGTSSQGRVSDSKLQVSTQQSLFTLEEVMCNLEKLALNSEDANMILQGQFSGEQFCKLKFLCLIKFEDDQATFPYWFLQNITSLEWLVVERSSFKEIFQDEGPIDEKAQFEIRTRIKLLMLNQLHELQHICKEGFQMDSVLEVLEYLEVNQCSNLKHLVPSSVTFSHLTYLEVQNCNGLIDLITSSTARSLVKLITMKIRECNSLEQVVPEEGEETMDEIAFSSLEVLELECLPRLKMFCLSKCLLKLPLLEKFVVRQCPRMKSFCARDTSAPMLRKILTDEQDEKWCWEGDLNRTVNKMFQDMVAFSSFNHLELSEYPELKELWYGPVGQKIFCNLKYLVVHKCVFLSNIIFSSNLLQSLYTLEELEVTECDSLEAVFDVTVGEDNVTHPKDVSRLKKLTLSRLPNLKHIWNTDPREMLSFRNLQVVKVAECKILKNLFSVSLCQELQQLEELDIESCGIEEIVAIGEGLAEVKFDFSQLTILRLIRLMQLNSFCPGRHTLECPSLKILSVGHCEALQIFAFGHLDSQQRRVGDVDMPIQQALFYVEKVSQNLKELSLNEKDAMRILNGRYEKNLFRGIKILRLQHFQETPIMFLNDLLERFPATTTFQVRWSSFETLFLSEEIGYCNIKSPSQIKNLRLFQLEQLKHIWSDDSVSDPLVQNLEDLFIGDCSRLIRLAPPSISFINLTTMEVVDCNGLIYLMTSFTAKSLVHLTSLTVKNCGMIEDVVMTDEGELEEQITFESLEYLELTSLSSFKSFCSGKHTFIFPSLVRLIVTGCHKMQNFSSRVTIAPFLKVVEVEKGKKRWKEDLNATIKQLFMDKAIREGDEGNYKESSSNISESSQVHQSTASTTGASSSEEHGGQSKPDQIADTGKQEMHKLPSLSFDNEQKEHTSSAYPPRIQGAQAAQNALSPSTVHDTVIGTQQMYETIKMPLVQVAQTAMSPTIAQDTAITTQELYETIEKPLVQTVQNTLSPTTIRDAATWAQEMCEAIERPLVQAAQNARSLTTIQNAEKSHALEILPSENLLSQTTHTIIAEKGKAIDLVPSQASDAISSSILVADAYTSSTEMIDISVQNLPYLKAGLKRHPQVLDWLNKKRRRVFASLFAEVTRLLRTTRRGDLTEDDRNYIRECCTCLEVVGFDASWLSYVYGCIEECGDGENLKRRLEEAEAKASILKKELASVEASLGLLRDKASRLDNFIES